MELVLYPFQHFGKNLALIFVSLNLGNELTSNVPFLTLRKWTTNMPSQFFEEEKTFFRHLKVFIKLPRNNPYSIYAFPGKGID